ncbi:RHS repeat domain-containing protein [Pseudomonas sp. D3-10]|uniref:RHS repeat domain-containing protein n=1 Tax=Pseudomonas sp. D3-10 TaxID=2817392 RepID=UPI003DA807CA
MGMDYRTPTLIAVDSRSLPVRSIGYCRSRADSPAQRRINRSLFDVAGHTLKQWDPRLWALQETGESTPANLSAVYSLSGTTLQADSVDAGRQTDLSGLAGEVLLGWDSRGTQRDLLHDELLRPVAVFEQGSGQPRRCTERLTYGSPGQGDQDHNQYGQLIRHDDTAGTLSLASFALTGHNLLQERRFILDAALPDWPEAEGDREHLLEPGDGAVSTWRVGPLGDVLERVDARGNRQRQGLTLDGRLSGSQLLLEGQDDWQALVSDIRYDAQGQIEQETAGNGVLTSLTYDPEDGRLSERQAMRADHVLQHLRYDYDPVGNVLGIEDQILPIRYFANQRIDPISRFTYDSLYQLIEATGWEAGTVNQGPDSVGRNDPAAVSNYRQAYRYDEAGNLLELTHVGAQSHGREIKAARHSNRCLPYRNGVPPTEDEIAAAFDAQGNCLELDAGRFLAWDLRNQLRSVTPIERDSGLNDSEAYVYDGGGQRARKLRTLQTGTRTLAAEVRYLPGLELRADSGTGEALQVIVAQGGLSEVRVLHWESTPPTGENDAYRFSVADHLGSVGLEVALDGRIISREHFYPFGETAYSAGENAIEVGYKTVRYSGKERDATGLYYYGFRYYVPWLQRWVNPDPAGAVDGLNLYAMVGNNPLTFVDTDGRIKEEAASDKGGTTPFIPSAPPFMPLSVIPQPPSAPGPPPPPPLAPGPPPPPAAGASSALSVARPPEQGEIFSPINLAPPEVRDYEPTASWNVENYVDLAELSRKISDRFKLPRQVIALEQVSQHRLNTLMSADRRMSPDGEFNEFGAPAWTAPDGRIYMVAAAPDYSNNGQIDADKIISTIIHESLHFSSFEHVGLQAVTDMTVAHGNYDEYVTDYFANEIFTEMFPGRVYKTGYFTSGNNGYLHWGGNMAKYMIDSGHLTRADLENGYFRTGKLKKLSASSMSKWQDFAKQNRRPLRM